MGERRISDSTRIGQLLASEITGLSVGVLAECSITGADADATPSEGGTRAYRIAHEEEVVGAVWLYPGHAELRLTGERGWPETAGGRMVSRERADSLRIEAGAGVKQAVDALRTVLAADSR
jgi:hypothetical protein